MTLKLLKKLSHKHRILAAGNADSDLVPLFNQVVIADGFHKHAVNVSFKLLSERFLDIFPSLV